MLYRGSNNERELRRDERIADTLVCSSLTCKQFPATKNFKRAEKTYTDNRKRCSKKPMMWYTVLSLIMNVKSLPHLMKDIKIIVNRHHDISEATGFCPCSQWGKCGVCSCVLQESQWLDSVSLLIKDSFEGDMIDNLSGSVFHHYCSSPVCKDCKSHPQEVSVGYRNTFAPLLPICLN